MKTNLLKMKPDLLRTSLLAGLLAAGSGYSLQASALPLEPFSFHQSTGFLVDATLVGSGGNKIGWYQFASAPPPPAGEFNTIAWGVPVTRGLLAANPIGPKTGDPYRDKSALRVIGHEGIVTTGAAVVGGSDWGAWQTITTVYHQNRAISTSANTLLAAVIQSVLTIDHSPEGPIISDLHPIGFTFTETPNSGPVASCPGGNPAGGPACNDFFKFALDGFAPISFMFGGNKYEMEFQLANFFSSAFDPSCPGDICTIYTAENVTSSLDVQTRIREVDVPVDVPEPATLALFGLGLLGLGFTQRRKLHG